MMKQIKKYEHVKSDAHEQLSKSFRMIKSDFEYVCEKIEKTNGETNETVKNVVKHV